MPRLGIRLEQACYDRLQECASARSLTVSDFVRESVRQAMEDDKEVSGDVSRRELERLEGQVQEKDKQISELHQLLAVSQKSIQQLTQQNQLLLEDKRKPLWRRLFRR